MAQEWMSTKEGKAPLVWVGHLLYLLAPGSRTPATELSLPAGEAPAFAGALLHLREAWPLDDGVFAKRVKEMRGFVTDLVVCCEAAHPGYPAGMVLEADGLTNVGILLARSMPMGGAAVLQQRGWAMVHSS